MWIIGDIYVAKHTWTRIEWNTMSHSMWNWTNNNMNMLAVNWRTRELGAEKIYGIGRRHECWHFLHNVPLGACTRPFWNVLTKHHHLFFFYFFLFFLIGSWGWKIGDSAWTMHGKEGSGPLTHIIMDFWWGCLSLNEVTIAMIG